MYKDNWYNNIVKSKLNPPSWVHGFLALCGLYYML